MTITKGTTEDIVTQAQTRILGKFCTRCRCHKATEGGKLLPAGSGRTRWVCERCLTIIREHKRVVGV